MRFFIVLTLIFILSGCAGFDMGMRTKHDAPPPPSTSTAERSSAAPRSMQTVDSRSSDDALEVIQKRCPNGHVETDTAFVPVTHCFKKWEDPVSLSPRCEQQTGYRVTFYCL